MDGKYSFSIKENILIFLCYISEYWKRKSTYLYRNALPQAGGVFTCSRSQDVIYTPTSVRYWLSHLDPGSLLIVSCVTNYIEVL